MSDMQTLVPAPARVPTVYFIDDSATMREVIKIAFRKENMHVITCPDAASALAQFATAAPDAVITDVIMPDKDGYQVCEFIKQHEQFGRTPVILMSGVVNRTVAERATSVKADELIRKPFQPQDLVVRVKGLLAAKFPALAASVVTAAPPPAPIEAPRPAASPALSSFFAPNPVPSRAEIPGTQFRTPAVQVAPAVAEAPGAAPVRPAISASAPSAELQRLRSDVLRLELLVKKLQAELEASRRYCESLEEHFKSLQSQ
jgi:CheY-like chemotaxis protein